MSQPNLEGNAFCLSCYATLLPAQLYCGIRHKTWDFLFGMTCGLGLEIFGYIARIQMHFGQKKFLMYIITLTIGPAFFSAAIYLCLAPIIAVYGEHLSRFRPRTYTITSMVSDFIALMLQASGGAITGDSDLTMQDMSIPIMQAGLSAHLLPSRWAEPGLPEQAGQERSRLHGARGRYGHHRHRLPDELAPGRLVPGPLGRGRF